MHRRTMLLAGGTFLLNVRESSAAVSVNQAALDSAIKLARSKGGSGAVYLSGKKIGQWGDQSVKYDLKSSTKSFGSILLGIAIGENRVSLDQKATSILGSFGTPPSNNPIDWRNAGTIKHLATHTCGFDKSGGFTKMLFKPGTKWSYSDGGANWLADLLTIRFGQDLFAVLRSKVLGRIGVSSGLTWRTNAYRPATIGNGIPRREFGSGISANVDVMAKVGVILADGGDGIIPSSYINQARAPIASVAALSQTGTIVHPGANKHYGLLFWNNGNAAMDAVPTDAYWSWGLGDSFILIVPSKRLVVARGGPAWHSPWGLYSTLQPFFKGVCGAVT